MFWDLASVFWVCCFGVWFLDIEDRLSFVLLLASVLGFFVVLAVCFVFGHRIPFLVTFARRRREPRDDGPSDHEVV